MSAENPEIGDVWIRGKHKYHVRVIRNFRQPFVYYISDDLIFDNQPLDIFLRNWSFAGHSKASIKDLFEVE